METLAKFIKAIFFLGDDPDKTAIQKFKDFILMAYVILTLLGLGLYFWAEDESSIEETTAEQVDE